MGVDIEQMIKVTGTSEYNFEFYIVVEDKKDLEKAKGICAKAYDDWWSETTDETIGYYISRALNERGIEHKRCTLDVRNKYLKEQLW